MRRVGFVGASIAAALATTCVVAGNASAVTPLILKEGGVVAPVGSPASGSLNLTCADLESAGTLTINDEPVDEAVFTEGGGTDVCEGVFVRGVVKAMKVTRTARFVVVSHLIYESVLAKTCVWVIGRFVGTFTVPGLTESTVTGKGKLLVKRSTPGCAEAITVGGRAVLSSGTTHEPYFAEP